MRASDWAALVLLAAASVSGWVSAGYEHQWGLKWKGKHDSVSSSSSSESSRYSSVGSSAGSSATSAASSVGADLKIKKQKSEFTRDEIIRESKGVVGIGNSLSPGLLNGLRAAHDRLCANAKASDQDRVCAGEDQPATDDTRTVPTDRVR